MTSKPKQSSDSIMSQSKERDKPSPKTFASLPREIRDQIYGYLVLNENGVVAATGRPTDYGNCKGFEAIRTILHASTSTTQFAREAYEVYFHQNIFRLYSQDLPEFVNRKTHYLKNQGYFDVNAWIGCLEVIVHESIRSSKDKLVEELRQLLMCPRLHTVSIQIECFNLTEKQLYEILQKIADVCAQLREKMGDRFKVETDGKEWWAKEGWERWAIGQRQPLFPWVLSSAVSTQ